MASREVAYEQCFEVQVQHGKDCFYTVLVPYRLCEMDHPEIQGVLECIRQAHPKLHAWTARLRMYNFEKAPWTVPNLHLLPDQAYIVLAESVDLIPDERISVRRNVPATRILTEPLPLSAQPGHLDPIFVTSCEFIDNSLRALRDSSHPKVISAIFNLATQSTLRADGVSASIDQDFIAFFDNGHGMSNKTFNDWSTMRKLPQEFAGGEQAAGITPYFADGNLSCFGVGSKNAAFTFGADLLVITKSKLSHPDPRLRDIQEMRINKCDQDRQDHEVARGFHFPIKTRAAGTPGLCRTDWELKNPALMGLINKVDQEEHFTLFVISALHSKSVQPLLAKPFSELCKMLKGMYFYYCVPGDRAAFIYGNGYKYGPVKINVTGFGFKESGDATYVVEEQSHELGSLPWSTWPQEPEAEEDERYEDRMHALARLSAVLTTPLQGVFREQIVGGKFVFGMIIRGGVDSMVPEDIFVKGYLHYMPYVDGKPSRPSLDLKDGVRWIAFWKGRQIPFADISAKLPFVQNSINGERFADSRSRMEEQVVGQLFFQSVTQVDQSKSKFNGAVDDQLRGLRTSAGAECWFHVVEPELYENAAYDGHVAASGLTRSSPGLTPTNAKRLQDEFKLWVAGCHRLCDQQFEVFSEDENEELSKPSYKAYNSLKAHHHQHTYQAQEVVVVRRMPGGALSLYTHDMQEEENRSTFYGCIKYFKVSSGQTGNDTIAVLTREPSEYFNNREFEFPVHKLSILSAKERDDQKAKLKSAFPHEIKVEFDSRQRLSSNLAMTFVARGQPVPSATVHLLNQLGEMVTHWTDATPTSARQSSSLAVKPFIVTQHIRFDEGPEAGHIIDHTAELVNSGDQGPYFQFREITLPYPGRYTTHFTARAQHQRGTEDPLRSTREYTYQAVCGGVTSCEVLEAPTGSNRLQSQLPSMSVKLCDDHGNAFGHGSVRIPDMVLTCPDLLVMPVPGHSASWESPEYGTHLLKLPPLLLQPTPSLAFEQANKHVDCTVTLWINGLPQKQPGTGQVSSSFTVSVLPGLATHLQFKAMPSVFSTTAAQPFPIQNLSSCPAFDLQMQDLDGYSTCTLPNSKSDSVSLRATISWQGSIISVPLQRFEAKVSMGVAKFKGLVFHVPKSAFEVPGAQGLVVSLVATATVGSSQSKLAPMEFTALVMPSCQPSVLRLYRADNLGQPLPIDSQAEDPTFVLVQEAGTQVEQLYLCLDNEAGNLDTQPEIAFVKIRRRQARFEMTGSSIRILLSEPCVLKAAKSVDDDAQDVELEVGGTDGWHCKANIRMSSSPGPPHEWKLVMKRSRQHDKVTNIENLGERVTAYLADRYHNPCGVLPASLNLRSDLQLLVQPVGAGSRTASPTARTEFVKGSASQSSPLQRSSIYAKEWVSKDGVLCMPNLAIAGPAGTVNLTLTGGTHDGQRLAAGTLSLQLQPGRIADMIVRGWPSGDQASHVAVNSLSVTLIDAASIPVSLPTGKFHARVVPADSSSAVSYSSSSDSGTLSVTKALQADALIIEPFSLFSPHQGQHIWRLELLKEQGGTWQSKDLTPFQMTRSQRIVKEVVLANVQDISSFSVDSRPSIRFKLKAEDGSFCRPVAELAHSVKAHCSLTTSTAQQQKLLAVVADDTDPSVLFCQLQITDACQQAGSYELSLVYTEAQAEALGLRPGEVTAAVTTTCTVLPGQPTKLALSDQHVSGRTVLNTGSMSQRTILPATTLRLEDQYGNIAKQVGSRSSLLVRLEVQTETQDRAPVTGFSISPDSAQIPLAEGVSSFGPILVQLHDRPEAALAGKYSLKISANSVPRVRLSFELLDSHGISQAQEQSLKALNDAKAAAMQVKARFRQKAETLRQQAADLLSKKQIVQQLCSSFVDDIDSADHQVVLQHINEQLEIMPAQRSQRIQLMQPLPLHNELMSIAGVLGYLRELICVPDDNDARLLSWHARRKLQTLVVANLAVAECVQQQIPGFDGTFLLLDLADNLQSRQLPHKDLSDISDAGNPTYFASLVTGTVDSQRSPISNAAELERVNGQVVQYACGSLIRMDSLRAAAQYMGAVKQHKSCSSILCQDSGKLLTSSGEIGTGPNFTAPGTFAALCEFFDDLPKKQRPEYHKWNRAGEVVRLMPQLESGVRKAKEEHSIAKAAVTEADAEVEQRQRDHNKACRQSAQLASVSDAGPSDITSLPSTAEAAAQAVQPSTQASTGRGHKRTRQEHETNADVSPDMRTPDTRVRRRRASNRST